MGQFQIKKMRMVLLAGLLLLGAVPLLAWQPAATSSASAAASDPATTQGPGNDGDEQDQESDKDLEPLRPARENDDLREFFLAQYFNLSRVEIRFLRRNPPPPGRARREFKVDRFVNHFIDQRIDHFVDNLEKTIEEGQAALAEIRRISGLVRQDFSQFKKVRGRWRKAFDKLAKKSDDLHDRIAMVFLPLDGGVDLDLETGREELRDGYAQEVERLEFEFSNGVQRVRDLLIQPSHTVSVSDLATNDSALTYLQRAKRLSEHLRGELKN